MATVTKEVREVYEEAVAIGVANDREKSRHRNASDRLMARAAENVYAAHQLDLVKPNGYTPKSTGAQGREEVKEAARRGVPLTAKSYAMLIGFSEAYISRLFRLGFGIAAGVLDPHEKPEGGRPTLWTQVSKRLGDTPEVGAVLGKNVEELPTRERLEAAIEAAMKRRASDRAEAAALTEEESWIPTAPSEQIGMMEELCTILHNGRHLTPRQIDRVRVVMDGLRELIEAWTAAEVGAGSLPEQRVPATVG